MAYRSSFSLNLTAFATVIRKEIARFMRIWPQTLFPPVITMSLYFLIFGQLIGSQINPIDGFSYAQYLVPGVVLMSIITNAYANTSSSFFLVKFNKSVEEMLIAPMSNLVILLGYTIGGTLRGLVIGVIVLAVSLMFTAIPFTHPFIILAMATLSAMVFSLGGLINAIYAKRFDDISFIPTFVLTPLTYLGGVFYSTKILPPFWRHLSIFNPICSMVDSFRFGILGISDISIYDGFLVVSLLLLVLFSWAWVLLAKGVGIKA